ncbi:MAG: hypothetical protein CL908_08170 [Deltaproteobacteria bacterium]|nr:hypothetical protein [Deltaproteobacteria bacterium]
MVTGLGICVPEPSLTNEQIEGGMPWLDTSARWIEEHTGIRRRHIAPTDQHATDLGFRAAQEALRLSGLEPEDIDLVLLATNTSQFIYPAGAVRIQRAFGEDGQGRLRMRNAGALDIQQGCASFLGGIVLASGLVRGAVFENVLVVGADVASRMVDWTDRDAILLGDGATAAVVTGANPPDNLEMPALEVLGHFMRTEPHMADAITQRGPLNAGNNPLDHIEKQLESGEPPFRAQLYGTDYFGGMADDGHCFFKMDGRKVYRFVKSILPRQGYLEVLRRAGVTEDAPSALQLDRIESLDEVKDRGRRQAIGEYLASKVNLFVPHGANLALNQELAEEMCIPFEKMYITLHKYGNTSAASVGLSLYESLRQESCYTTLTRRDAQGGVKVPGQEIVVPALAADQVALLLSFGTGASWNYIVVRRA